MSQLLTSIRDEILTITLNRPNQYNSITETVALDFQKALKTAESDEIRCVIIKAAGKAFCAGQDLNEVTEKLDEPDFTLSDTVEKSYNPIIRTIRTLGKPVLCAVQGVAAGAGANLVLACDIVIASTDAFFIQAFSQISLIPDSGGTWFLPRLAGFGRANALYLMNERLTAQQAAEAGIIWKVTSPELLDAEVEETAAKLASLPMAGVALYKRAMLHTFTNTLDDQLHLEAELQAEAGSSMEFREGVTAFIEKRPPQFRKRDPNR